MVRKDQYLSIDTKIKFIEFLVAKIQGIQQPPLVRRVANNALIRRGLKSLFYCHIFDRLFLFGRLLGQRKHIY